MQRTIMFAICVTETRRHNCESGGTHAETIRSIRFASEALRFDLCTKNGCAYRRCLCGTAAVPGDPAFGLPGWGPVRRAELPYPLRAQLCALSCVPKLLGVRIGHTCVAHRVPAI